MRLTSPAFSHEAAIPAKYTCNGENVNPQLDIAEVPAGTQSFALIMDDPDAPGGLFTHWMLWNIAPTIVRIEEGTVPAGAVEGVTSFGKRGYGGPCPPSGTHRYFFTLYALNTFLDLTPDATREQLEASLEGAVAEHAHLMGLYGS